MPHVYDVETSQGAYKVPVDHHHDHLSKADFERILLTTLLGSGLGLASGLILHRYTYKGSH